MNPAGTAAAQPRQKGDRKEYTVDIADCKIVNEPNASLITYSLGSCIGVAIWDPITKVGGMLHYMLPESQLSAEKAKANPAMFADTGLTLLFRSAYAKGAVKSRLKVKVAGGSQLLDESGTFNIGKRNYIMLRKLFWKNGILIEAEDVGGSISRTMQLDCETGVVRVYNRQREVEL